MEDFDWWNRLPDIHCVFVMDCSSTWHCYSVLLLCAIEFFLVSQASAIHFTSLGSSSYWKVIMVGIEWLLKKWSNYQSRIQIFIAFDHCIGGAGVPRLLIVKKVRIKIQYHIRLVWRTWKNKTKYCFEYLKHYLITKTTKDMRVICKQVWT